jgi:sugar/nucleoside kinase (ribokinase family)
VTDRLDVLAVGDLNPDLLVSGDVTPRFGQAEQDVSARLTLGGSAGIFAAGAARLGLGTAIAATIGDDDLGRATRAMLVARGVDDGLVGVDPDRPTGLSINLQREDDRAILTDRGAIPALDVAAAVAAIERGVRHVHIASLFLIPALAREGGALLRTAHSVGATVSVDTNFDPQERFAAPEWLRDADVLTPNEAEALGLVNRGDEEQLATAPQTASQGDEDPLAAARDPALRDTLPNRGDDAVLAAAHNLAARVALVVVKRGAAGAVAVRGAEVVEAPAPKAGGPDSVGAGDSFDAGLVWALLDGRPLPEALGIACACGALSLRAAGGVDGQATLEEALRLAAELRSAR